MLQFRAFFCYGLVCNKFVQIYLLHIITNIFITYHNKFCYDPRSNIFTNIFTASSQNPHLIWENPKPYIVKHYIQVFSKTISLLLHLHCRVRWRWGGVASKAKTIMQRQWKQPPQSWPRSSASATKPQPRVQFSLCWNIGAIMAVFQLGLFGWM